MDIAMIATDIVLFAMVMCSAYMFVKISERYGLAKGLGPLMVLVDIYAIILMILGIARPLITIYFGRLGTSITVTALMLFLSLKISLTIYLTLRAKQLQQVPG